MITIGSLRGDSTGPLSDFDPTDPSPFQQALNQAGHAVMITDADGIIHYVNDAFTEITGYDRSEVLGNTPSILKSGEQDDEYYKNLWSHLQKGRVWKEEIVNQKADGSHYPALQTISPIFSGGTLTGFIAIQEDITDRKKLEDELTASLDSQTTLFREVLHRVRNNLQLIISLINLQIRDTELSSQEVIQAFQDIENRIYSLALIHDQVYEQRSLDQIPVPEYFKELAKHVVENTTSSDLEVRVSTEIQPLELDVDTLIPCGLVINELISNAIQHGFEDQSKGTIRVELDENQTGTYRLQVADNGMGGLNEESFEESSGLGLRLVKNLVRNQLKGNINLVETEDGVTYEIAFQTNPHSDH